MVGEIAAARRGGAQLKVRVVVALVRSQDAEGSTLHV
jgi:hypothetical protein